MNCNHQAISKSPQTQSGYTFSAKEKDDETGYSYFGARYYDSELSVWLSVDPLAGKYPSLSPYNYCAGNPIKYIDPDGNEIIVSRIKGENGAKDLVKITVTGKIINSSNAKISCEEMLTIRDQISSQISESFGKEFEGCVVNVETNLDVIDNMSETNEKDHVFIIVNPNDVSMVNPDGSENSGASKVGGQIAKLNSKIVSNIGQLKNRCWIPYLYG